MLLDYIEKPDEELGELGRWRPRHIGKVLALASPAALVHAPLRAINLKKFGRSMDRLGHNKKFQRIVATSAIAAGGYFAMPYMLTAAKAGMGYAKLAGAKTLMGGKMVGSFLNRQGGGAGDPPMPSPYNRAAGEGGFFPEALQTGLDTVQNVQNTVQQVKQMRNALRGPAAEDTSGGDAPAPAPVPQYFTSAPQSFPTRRASGMNTYADSGEDSGGNEGGSQAAPGGMSKEKMIMLGVGGVAALGLVFALTRGKKK